MSSPNPDRGALRREEKLLFLCARVEVSESDLIPLREISSSDPDWEYLVTLSSSHRVSPLLYQNLKKYIPNGPPKSVLNQLKAKVMQNGGKNLFLVRSLLSILGLLRDHGIQALTFKGPVLAENVFGNVGLRTFSDLDLLISHKDLRKAICVLEEQGFRQDIDLSSAQYEKLVNKWHHAVLIKDGVVVELHWELNGRYFSKDVTLESLWPRIEHVDLFGHEVATLGPEDLLLYLCIHGCRHLWLQLDAVCCVAEVVRKKADLDWDLVFGLAQDLGAVKMLLLGLMLARELLGTVLPENIAQMLLLYPKLKEIAGGIAAGIFTSSEMPAPPMSYREYIVYHYCIMDRRRDCLRYCLRPLFNPTHSDWLWVRLPASLSFLYFLLRPFRLVGKNMNKLFR